MLSKIACLAVLYCTHFRSIPKHTTSGYVWTDAVCDLLLCLTVHLAWGGIKPSAAPNLRKLDGQKKRKKFAQRKLLITHQRTPFSYPSHLNSPQPFPCFMSLYVKPRRIHQVFFSTQFILYKTARKENR